MITVDSPPIDYVVRALINEDKIEHTVDRMLIDLSHLFMYKPSNFGIYDLLDINFESKDTDWVDTLFMSYMIEALIVDKSILTDKDGIMDLVEIVCDRMYLTYGTVHPNDNVDWDNVVTYFNKVSKYLHDRITPFLDNISPFSDERSIFLKGARFYTIKDISSYINENITDMKIVIDIYTIGNTIE